MQQNVFNPDFQDFIAALNTSEVAYILVDGYSVILHGYNRTTGDMDIWVKPSEENYTRLLKAFSKFGMSVFEMNLNRFLTPSQFNVFTFGRPPVSIDIITQLRGLTFDSAFAQAEWFEITETLSVRSLRLSDLVDAKKSAGRPKDLDDLEHLLT